VYENFDGHPADEEKNKGEECSWISLIIRGIITELSIWGTTYNRYYEKPYTQIALFSV